MTNPEQQINQYSKEGECTVEEWGRCVDNLYRSHPGGGVDGVLPPHFLKATYPKIGAKIIHVGDNRSQYWGLVMPEFYNSEPGWIVRGFWTNTPNDKKTEVLASVNGALTENGMKNIRHYEYDSKHREYFQTRDLRKLSNGVELKEPSSKQAVEAQQLQQKVWSVDDPAFLYPSDLYHPEAGLATRLVAVDDNEVIGFLFGFYGHGKQWYGPKAGFQQGQWVESQLMGIDESQRRRGIGRSLKLAQRERSLQEGLSVVHWTVDPLQIGNAFLNMNTLGGVAVQHYRDYYVFRNALNRVAASRIGVSWILDSPRVEEHSRGNKSKFDYHNLSNDSGTEIVTPVAEVRGGLETFQVESWNPGGDCVLLEVPSDWNSVQRKSVKTAEAWRDTSDDILEKVLSASDEQYAITGAVTDATNDKGFLVIEKISKNLGL